MILFIGIKYTVTSYSVCWDFLSKLVALYGKQTITQAGYQIFYKFWGPKWCFACTLIEQNLNEFATDLVILPNKTNHQFAHG